MYFGTIVIVSIVLVMTITAIVLYNRLIGYKNEIDNMMGSIDAILKKRFDLIPNLVASVQQYSIFERSLLEKITLLRSAALAPGISAQDKADISSRTSAALRELMLTVENYPQLKANLSFLHLQQSISIIEHELSAARRVYNQAVTDYNNAREMFPSNIVAHFMKLEPADVFTATDDERTVPDIKELFAS